MTDPDSLKLMPNGALLLTGEADGAYIFVKHPGTAQQTDSFVTLPEGDVADDAIMPTVHSGTFFISNQGANDVVSVKVTGLNTHDLYADITVRTNWCRSIRRPELSHLVRVSTVHTALRSFRRSRTRKRQTVGPV